MTFLKKYKILIAVIAIIIGMAFLISVQPRKIIVNKITEKFAQIKNSDKKCEKPMRPLAIMLSSDKEARPLAGIGQADIVFEMPVTNNGITRMMAAYYCSKPTELGSVRSARLDFIPLALGLGAIYAHWGGEHTALEQLNSGVIDNLDGLKYEGIYYYRKKGRYGAPHNGFISFENIQKGIDRLNYSADPIDLGYSFNGQDKSLGDIVPSSAYAGQLKVDWEYDKNKNTYKRIRGGTPEVDSQTKTQVEVKNIAKIYTDWTPIDVNYIRVKTVGSGKASFYFNGTMVEGTWSKQKAEDPLLFFDNNGKQIDFAPGNLWIQIII